MILPKWVRNMSLFHDIKLKRRKVDSHCSSDGETSGDLNTSSPESVTPENLAKDSERGNGNTETFNTHSSSAQKDDPGTSSGFVSTRQSPNRLKTKLNDNPGSHVKKEPDDSAVPGPSNIGRMGPRQGFESRNGTLESPQHERRNSVFDGGGSELSNEGSPEGLDLSRNRRNSGNPNSRSPPCNNNVKVEDHDDMTVVRFCDGYATPLVMGVIPGAGPGKTMMWTSPKASSHRNGEQPSTSSQGNPSEPPQQPSNSSGGFAPKPSSANSSRECNSLSPRSQQLSLYSPSSSSAASAGAVTPVHRPTPLSSHLKTSSIFFATSYINRTDRLLGYPPNTNKSVFPGRNASPPNYNRNISPPDYSRYWAESNASTSDSHRTPTSALPPSPPADFQDSQALNLTLGQQTVNKSTPSSSTVSPSSSTSSTNNNAEEEEEEQPMICMICEDKATGLHYGIITCEGCKGFFKRTVQNKRVYTCVGEGMCEITKAQRNRCQYCRFQKCLKQGMVLAAVREDRMPGGRNSGAVYNLYKVKYKKHKKGQKNGQVRHLEPPKNSNILAVANTGGNNSHMNGNSSNGNGYPGDNRYRHQVVGLPKLELGNGQILKAALTSPTEAMRIRHQLESLERNSQERNMTQEQAMSFISQLVACDNMEDMATLEEVAQLREATSEISDKLCEIGDTIVFKLVQWTKRLPFYPELPVQVHTQLLTHKWHELLVLTTSAYWALRTKNNRRNNDGTSSSEASSANGCVNDGSPINGCSGGSSSTNECNSDASNNNVCGSNANKGRRSSGDLMNRSNGYNCTVITSNGYDSTPGTNNGYASAVSATNGYSSPASSSSAYSSPACTSNGYGGTVSNSNGYNSPTSTNNGYSNSTSPSNIYSSANSSYSSAPSSSNGYSNIPNTNNNYISVASTSNGYSNALMSSNGLSNIRSNGFSAVSLLTNVTFSSSRDGRASRPHLELHHRVGMGLCTLHSVLGAMMEGTLSLDQLKIEAGQLIEQLTQLTATFRKLQLCLEEYVCLKVVAMLRQGYESQTSIDVIHDRYLTALKIFVENRFPQQTGRFNQLLLRLPEIQSAGQLMLNSNMFYVPYLLNNTTTKR